MPVMPLLRTTVSKRALISAAFSADTATLIPIVVARDVGKRPIVPTLGLALEG